MTPNISIYGAAATWLHVLPESSYNEDNKNFVPAWTTLKNGITQNKFNYGTPIDDSICYAAIAEDAPVSGIYAFQGNNYQNGIEYHAARENFAVFFAKPLRSSVMQIDYYDITDTPFSAKYVYSPNIIMVDSNPNAALQPMVSISPKDFVMLIYVTASMSDYSDTISETLADYKTNSHFETYPKIIQVYAKLYSRTDTDTRSAQSISDDEFGGVMFGRLSEFELPVMGNVIDYARFSKRSTGDVLIHLWGMTGEARHLTYDNNANYVHVAVGNGTIKNTGGYFFTEHDYSENFVLSVAASYGMFFTTSETAAATAAYNSDDMYIGVIDNDGLCHGVYTHGTDNEEQQQYTWSSTNDSTYNPEQTYDNTKYDNATHFNTQASVGSCNKRYIITEEVLNKCVGELATALTTYTTDTTQESSLKAFLTNNPMDCIISLKKFPVNNIPGYSLTPTQLKFGAYTSSDATIVGRELTKAWSQYDFTFSNNNRNGIYPVYGDTFLDYEPYTRAELIIPFCGTVQIPLANFMGHDIRVRLIIDFVTGACTAFIMRDLMAVMSISGQAGVDIGISGVQTATLDSQITNANMQYKAAQLNAKETTVSAFAQTISSGLKADVGGVIERGVSNYYNMEHAALYEQQAQYNAEHVQVPFKQLSASTGVISLAYEQACRLVIYRPKLSPDYDADVYAKTVGFACLKNGKVSDFSGLTVGAINLNGVPCTAEEKTMIINDFARGVIL